tara:strand:+ start:273 stop:518 length:246 start_codon:yes stop_codon:yes gene_type:complete
MIRGLLMAQGVSEPIADALMPIVEETEKAVVQKVKRKASDYSKRYGRAFKKIQSRYKKKDGTWKSNGFKRCAAEARKLARR